MLNISSNSIRESVDTQRFAAFRFFNKKRIGFTITRVLLITLFLFIIIMFLPWTQNVQSKAIVTSLLPEQRPQTIQASISGKIEKWYVKEGDFVHKGDTILRISEIKPEYLTPDLVNQTDEQIQAKEGAVVSYEDKITALTENIEILKKSRDNEVAQIDNEIQQAKFKVQSDSAYVEAMKLNKTISDEQFQRYDELYADGLISKTDYEKRKNTLQKAENDYINALNKYEISKNDLINYKLKRQQKINMYGEKIAKANSDLFSAQSSFFEGKESVAKLRIQRENYSIRQGQYTVLAPQDGYVNKIKKTGIGEILKEGEELLSITPSSYNLAVEAYVRPLDLPLLELGQHVRIQFDGWPAIVFSGWPNTSHGTFGGEIVAIDNFISENGMYRILIAEEEGGDDWPHALRPGAGARAMILLKDVPVWYEIWRNLNGFPPDYTKEIHHQPVKEKAK